MRFSLLPHIFKRIRQAQQTISLRVLCRYIEKPLLIGGRKFDLRLFVLVTSYRPLKAYISMQGFARLCSDRYDSSGTDLDNRMVHLTNASVQRFGESYNASHGNKWSLDSLRLYLESTRGKNETDKLFARIRELVVVSLRACSRVIVQDKCALFNSSLKGCHCMKSHWHS